MAARFGEHAHRKVRANYPRAMSSQPGGIATGAAAQVEDPFVQAAGLAQRGQQPLSLFQEVGGIISALRSA
jgi:hypothetical protein